MAVLQKLYQLRAQINTRVLYTVLSALVIIAGTYLAIQYAQGGFRYTNQGFVPRTGLLNANSFPTGAEVYIDGKLVTATDDTIYLEPKEYHVKIAKDGYSSWEKTLKIEEQLVAQTNAQLFPVAPSLSPLTFTGVSNVVPSPDGQKLAYFVASASSQTKIGLYVLDLSSIGNLMGMQKGARQITENGSHLDLGQAHLVWSPDSSDLFIMSDNGDIVVSTDKKTDLSTATDIGWKKKTILSEWEHDMYLRERQFMAKFPTQIATIATESAKNVYLSPDKKRLLYTATASASIPTNLVPALPASNNQPEKRTLTPGKIYVYDREEDKNFEIATELSVVNAVEKRLLANDLATLEPKTLVGSPGAFLTLQATQSAQTALNFNSYHSSLYINTMQWFPDSKHVLFIRDGKVQVMSYDGTNVTTIYSGPFSQNFVYPWPDGSRLIILTAFSPDSPLNLYTIELK